MASQFSGLIQSHEMEASAGDFEPESQEEKASMQRKRDPQHSPSPTETNCTTSTFSPHRDYNISNDTRREIHYRMNEPGKDVSVNEAPDTAAVKTKVAAAALEILQDNPSAQSSFSDLLMVTHLEGKETESKQRQDSLIPYEHITLYPILPNIDDMQDNAVRKKSNNSAALEEFQKSHLLKLQQWKDQQQPRDEGKTGSIIDSYPRKEAKEILTATANSPNGDPTISEIVEKQRRRRTTSPPPRGAGAEQEIPYRHSMETSPEQPAAASTPRSRSNNYSPPQQHRSKHHSPSRIASDAPKNDVSSLSKFEMYHKQLEQRQQLRKHREQKQQHQRLWESSSSLLGGPPGHPASIDENSASLTELDLHTQPMEAIQIIPEHSELRKLSPSRMISNDSSARPATHYEQHRQEVKRQQLRKIREQKQQTQRLWESSSCLLNGTGGNLSFQMTSSGENSGSLSKLETHTQLMEAKGAIPEYSGSRRMSPSRVISTDYSDSSATRFELLKQDVEQKLQERMQGEKLQQYQQQKESSSSLPVGQIRAPTSSTIATVKNSISQSKLGLHQPPMEETLDIPSYSDSPIMQPGRVLSNNSSASSATRFEQYKQEVEQKIQERKLQEPQAVVIAKEVEKIHHKSQCSSPPQQAKQEDDQKYSPHHSVDGNSSIRPPQVLEQNIWEFSKMTDSSKITERKQLLASNQRIALAVRSQQLAQQQLQQQASPSASSSLTPFPSQQAKPFPHMYKPSSSSQVIELVVENLSGQERESKQRQDSLIPYEYITLYPILPDLNDNQEDAVRKKSTNSAALEEFQKSHLLKLQQWKDQQQPKDERKMGSNIDSYRPKEAKEMPSTTANNPNGDPTISKIVEKQRRQHTTSPPPRGADAEQEIPYRHSMETSPMQPAAASVPRSSSNNHPYPREHRSMQHSPSRIASDAPKNDKRGLSKFEMYHMQLEQRQQLRKHREQKQQHQRLWESSSSLLVGPHGHGTSIDENCASLTELDLHTQPMEATVVIPEHSELQRLSPSRMISNDSSARPGTHFEQQRQDVKRQQLRKMQEQKQQTQRLWESSSCLLNGTGGNLSFQMTASGENSGSLSKLETHTQPMEAKGVIPEYSESRRLSPSRVISTDSGDSSATRFEVYKQEVEQKLQERKQGEKMQQYQQQQESSSSFPVGQMRAPTYPKISTKNSISQSKLGLHQPPMEATVDIPSHSDSPRMPPGRVLSNNFSASSATRFEQNEEEVEQKIQERKQQVVKTVVIAKEVEEIHQKSQCSSPPQQAKQEVDQKFSPHHSVDGNSSNKPPQVLEQNIWEFSKMANSSKTTARKQLLASNQRIALAVRSQQLAQLQLQQQASPSASAELTPFPSLLAKPWPHIHKPASSSQEIEPAPILAPILGNPVIRFQKSSGPITTGRLDRDQLPLRLAADVLSRPAQVTTASQDSSRHRDLDQPAVGTYPSQQAKELHQSKTPASNGKAWAAVPLEQDILDHEISLEGTSAAFAPEGSIASFFSSSSMPFTPTPASPTPSQGTSQSLNGRRRRRRLLTTDEAAKVHIGNRSHNGGEVRPGAYQAAPGKGTQRNQPIRNSVISFHSLSAQMSRRDVVGPTIGIRSSIHRGQGQSNESFEDANATQASEFNEATLAYSDQLALPDNAVNIDRKMAASLSSLCLDSSSEEDEKNIDGNASFQAKGKDSIKPPPDTDYRGSSPTRSLTITQAPSPPSSSFSVRSKRPIQQAVSSLSKGSQISNKTEYTTSQSSLQQSSLSSQGGEEKEEIQSLDEVDSSGDQSTVPSLRKFPRGRNSKVLPVDRKESRSLSPTGPSQNPTATGSSSMFFSAGRRRRFTNLNAYAGSGHTQRKLSLLSEHSSTMDDSSGSIFSSAELKSRMTSLGSTSASSSISVHSAARTTAGRIARNMSLYMRAGALPVAATVVGSDDDLESELREQLEFEIRRELEIEMEEFRRQVILDIVGAAEPLTANVISVESIPDESPRSDELDDLQDNLRERERIEATAVRSDVNRELGRMYVEMKSSRFVSVNDGSSRSFDEELGKLDRVTHMSDPNVTTWGRVVVVLVIGMLSGMLLGVGIMAAAAYGSKGE